MKTLQCHTLILLLGLFYSTFISAQNQLDTTKKVIIIMHNKESFTGKIISKDSLTLILRTDNGNMNLRIDKIQSIKINDYNGRFSFSSPNKSSYFLGQSAIPINSGTGYYENIMLTSQILDYGLTKNISVGGGVELISLFYGYPIWFFTPKVAFNITDYFHIGCGLMMVGVIHSNHESSVELGYGVVTIGNSDYNISASVGEGYSMGSYTKNPQVMINGTCRISNRIGIISENYLITISSGTPYYAGIQGIRLMSKESSFDFGLTIIKNEPIPFPIVTYTHIF